MDRSEALKSLSSKSQHERLRAARTLSTVAKPNDFQRLQAAWRKEKDSYVKANLERALERLRQTASPSVGEAEVPGDVKDRIWSQAVEWITGMLLHEVASPVGLIDRAASKEIGNYQSSQTKRYIEGLKRVFEAIEQLRQSASTPRPSQFDLAALIEEIVQEEREARSRDVGVSLHGPKPLLAHSDRALVMFAIRNGVRNAVESVEALPDKVSHPIVVTWGRTDHDYWVSVLDRGVGVTGPLSSAFTIGKTTKAGHKGFGLAIAREAAKSLSGVVTLESAAEGGAAYEFRWSRSAE